MWCTGIFFFLLRNCSRPNKLAQPICFPTVLFPLFPLSSAEVTCNVHSIWNKRPMLGHHEKTNNNRRDRQKKWVGGTHWAVDWNGVTAIYPATASVDTPSRRGDCGNCVLSGDTQGRKLSWHSVTRCVRPLILWWIINDVAVIYHRRCASRHLDVQAQWAFSSPCSKHKSKSQNDCVSSIHFHSQQRF